MDEARGYYNRGYLPHIDLGEHPQFVTWRLTDSLPARLLQAWKQELATAAESQRKNELARRVNKHLDLGEGSCLLKAHAHAKIVQDSLIFCHPERYRLHAWCLMPNHVHVLFTPSEGWSLDTIVQGIKSFTSHEIGKLRGIGGSVWAEDYYDRFIRSEGHFVKTRKYIEWNPVKAKLCENMKHWPYSSACEVAWSRVAGKQASSSLSR